MQKGHAEPGGVSAALATGLVWWLRQRTGDLVVRARGRGGQVVELSAKRVRGLNPTQLRELVHHLAGELGGRAPRAASRLTPTSADTRPGLPTSGPRGLASNSDHRRIACYVYSSRLSSVDEIRESGPPLVSSDRYGE
jgi:Effector Associated Constant Component 1